MFNSIILILAMVLSALLASASLYYGGSAYLSQKDIAKSEMLLKGAQQIHLAAENAKADGLTNIANDAQLKTQGYLLSAVSTQSATVSNSNWQFLDPALVGAFILPNAVELSVCQYLNLKSTGSADVHPGYRLDYRIQCVGTGPAFHVLVAQNPYSLESELQTFQTRTGILIPPFTAH